MPEYCIKYGCRLVRAEISHQYCIPCTDVMAGTIPTAPDHYYYNMPREYQEDRQ